jgi:nucleotide-binding universal stress UspA family protein
MTPALIADVEPDSAWDRLDELAAEMRARGVDVDGTVVRGPAASVLLNACRDADLLVMGTRGRGGFARLLLGSTSHQCATHATIPVVVVPSTADVEHELTRIVVGMDASPGARAALSWAIGFAGPALGIHVVGAWTRAGWVAADIEDSDPEIEESRADFHAAIGEIETVHSASGRVVREFVRQHPATALLDAVSTTDLLVVGERGHRGLVGAFLGSVSTEVLHRSTSAVVVVPASD